MNGMCRHALCAKGLAATILSLCLAGACAVAAEAAPGLTSANAPANVSANIPAKGKQPVTVQPAVSSVPSVPSASGTPSAKGTPHAAPGIWQRLLAGSLTGALALGTPFSGIAVPDLAAVALAGYVLLKIIRYRRRGGAAKKNAPPGREHPAKEGGPPPAPAACPAANSVRNDAGGRDTAGPPPPAAKAAEPSDNMGVVIADFDETQFLHGAKKLYARMQRAWDARDLTDMAHYVTGPLLADIRSQAEADPDPTPAELLLVEARLVSLQRQGDQYEAGVLFEALLREDGGAAVQVRELWYGVRAVSGGMWMLDSIQAVEDA